MKEKLVELIKYGFWGCVTTGINLLLFVLFDQLGMYYLMANTVAYFIAVIINYIFNRKYVFNTGNKNKRETYQELIKFIMVRVIALLLDNILFYGVVDILRINKYVGRIGLTIIIISATYFINKIFVFKKEV